MTEPHDSVSLLLNREQTMEEELQNKDTEVTIKEI